MALKLGIFQSPKRLQTNHEAPVLCTDFTMLYFVAIHKGMVTVPATSIKDVVAGRPIFRPSEAGTRDYVGPDDMAVKYVFVWPFFPLARDRIAP